MEMREDVRDAKTAYGRLDGQYRFRPESQLSRERVEAASEDS